VDRTIESLEQIVYGLYPPTQCAPNVVPLIFVRQVRISFLLLITYLPLYRNRVEDNLVSNILGCPRLELLEQQFAEGMLLRLVVGTQFQACSEQPQLQHGILVSKYLIRNCPSTSKENPFGSMDSLGLPEYWIP